MISFSNTCTSCHQLFLDPDELDRHTIRCGSHQHGTDKVPKKSLAPTRRHGHLNDSECISARGHHAEPPHQEAATAPNVSSRNVAAARGVSPFQTKKTVRMVSAHKKKSSHDWGKTLEDLEMMQAENRSRLKSLDHHSPTPSQEGGGQASSSRYNSYSGISVMKKRPSEAHPSSPLLYSSRQHSPSPYFEVVDVDDEYSAPSFTLQHRSRSGSASGVPLVEHPSAGMDVRREIRERNHINSPRMSNEGGRIRRSHPTTTTPVPQSQRSTPASHSHPSADPQRFHANTGGGQQLYHGTHPLGPPIAHATAARSSSASTMGRANAPQTRLKDLTSSPMTPEGRSSRPTMDTRKPSQVSPSQHHGRSSTAAATLRSGTTSRKPNPNTSSHSGASTSMIGDVSTNRRNRSSPSTSLGAAGLPAGGMTRTATPHHDPFATASTPNEREATRKPLRFGSLLYSTSSGTAMEVSHNSARADPTPGPRARSSRTEGRGDRTAAPFNRHSSPTNGSATATPPSSAFSAQQQPSTARGVAAEDRKRGAVPQTARSSAKGYTIDIRTAQRCCTPSGQGTPATTRQPQTARDPPRAGAATYASMHQTQQSSSLARGRGVGQGKTPRDPKESLEGRALHHPPGSGARAAGGSLSSRPTPGGVSRMRFCTQCGKKYAEEKAKFCGYCGQKRF